MNEGDSAQEKALKDLDKFKTLEELTIGLGPLTKKERALVDAACKAATIDDAARYLDAFLKETGRRRH